MRKILVVEDEDAIREVVALNLRLAGYEVTEAASAEQALAVFSPSAGFDVAVLDIMLPGMNGFSLCETIRRDSASIGIIMLSAKTLETDKIKGLSIGADDYMTKPFNILELKARIKAVLRRSAASREEKAPAKNELQIRDLLVDLDSRRVFVDGKEAYLTAKEFDLLELLMKTPGKVYSREKLLDTVWGFDYPGDVRTVDVHVRRLREKIEKKPSAPEYIFTKWGVGYYFG